MGFKDICCLLMANLFVFSGYANEARLYSKSGHPLASNIQDYMEAVGKMRASCAILVTSDRGRDNAGLWAKKALEEQGHQVISFQVIPNNEAQIKNCLQTLINQNVDAIFTLGGTGFSLRDTTVDVVEQLIEKPMPGFGELFRLATHEEWKNLYAKIPEMALLTRATAGKTKNSYLFSLPGSLDAVQMSITIILPTLPVLLGERLKELKS